VGADIHKPLKDASVDSERQVGPEARLDLAGEREATLAILRLHNFGVDERGALDRSRGAVIAGAQ
jgi:hypothetical protein